MGRVNLFFESFTDQEAGSHPIIRLKGGIQFKTERGWSLPYSAIIDTGAHISVLPRSVWQDALIRKQGYFTLFGLSKKEECGISGEMAHVTFILVDEGGNQTPEMEMFTFLAETDELPLVLGFYTLLERFTVHFNLRDNIAFVEGGEHGFTTPH